MKRGLHAVAIVVVAGAGEVIRREVNMLLLLLQVLEQEKL